MDLQFIFHSFLFHFSCFRFLRTATCYAIFFFFTPRLFDRNFIDQTIMHVRLCLREKLSRRNIHSRGECELRAWWIDQRGKDTLETWQKPTFELTFTSRTTNIYIHSSKCVKVFVCFSRSSFLYINIIIYIYIYDLSGFKQIELFVPLLQSHEALFAEARRERAPRASEGAQRPVTFPLSLYPYTVFSISSSRSPSIEFRYCSKVE